jgi:hypothetical protein
MTQPDTTAPDPAEETLQKGSPAIESAPESEPSPEPEPWTPERVLEWNAYYDVYVMLAVLLLTFVVSAVKLNNSTIWTHLKTGELIAQQGKPILSDPFTYSETGQRWVDIPWLYQLASATIYRFVHDLVPQDPEAQASSAASADQIAIGSLIALHAFLRLLTAWLLLRIRRPGPGLWWTAVCVTCSLGVVYGPFGVGLGGIALPGFVMPSTWGLFLLALELLLLHRAYNEGQRAALYFLVPLMLLWANSDETFFIGLLVLAAAVVGRLLDGSAASSLIVSPAEELTSSTEDGAKSGVRQPVSALVGLVVLGLAIAVSLLNPSTYHIYSVALSPIQRLFGPSSEVYTLGEISFFGKELQKQYPSDWYQLTV